MKRLATGLLLCLLMCLTLSSAVCAQGGNTVTLTEADNNGMVSLSVGDTLVVRLPSNPSTGYSWSVAQNNPALLEPGGAPSYQRAGLGLFGVPGYQALLFRAVSAGGERLALIYQKPGQGGVPAADVFRVLVVVNRNGSGGGSKTVTLTEGDNNGRVVLNVGDTLVVRLAANASTGYSWSVAQNNPALLEPVGAPSYSQGAGGLLGAAGTAVFTFKAAGAGGEGLTLLYQNPSLRGVQAADTFRVLVVVNPSGSGGGGGGGKTVTLTEADNNGMVSLSVGDTLVVRLPSNPSTGYSWSVAQNNPGVPLQPIGSPSFERREDVPPGAPGVQVFRFRAAGGGSSFLRMIYHRPFEPGFDAARRWSAFVTITPNLLSGAP